MAEAEVVTQYLGPKGLEYTPKFVRDVLRRAGRWVDLPARSPSVVRERIERDVAEVVTGRGEDRTAQTQAAVDQGLILLELRQFREVMTWKEMLGQCGVSASTARNKMDLALFSRRRPDLYEKLKRLGPTRLYRLARLTDEELSALDWHEKVDTGGKRTLVIEMSDRELIAHLRRTFGPRPRSLRMRVEERIASVLRVISRAPMEERKRVELLAEVIQRFRAQIRPRRDEGRRAV